MQRVGNTHSVTGSATSKVLLLAVFAGGLCLASTAVVAAPRDPGSTTVDHHRSVEPPEIEDIPPPLPKTASLTIRSVVTKGSASRTVVVLTDGAPPGQDLIAVDSTGTNVAPVAVLGTTSRGCKSAETLQTGIGRDRWCLRFKNVAAGQPYQVVLHGASTVLTLTLTTRNNLVFPVLAALGALLVAVLLLMLATRFLPDLLTKRQLARAMRDTSISGLRRWADTAQGRLSPADIVARLQWARRYGRAQVLGARTQLHRLLDNPETHLPDCPLREAAIAEVNRPDTDVGADELLTPSGARAVSPAERLLQDVEQATAARKAFDQVCTGLLEDIPRDDDNRATAEDLWRQGDDYGTGFLSDFTIDTYVAGLRTTLNQIQALVPAQGQPVSTLAMRSLAMGALSAGGREPALAQVRATMASVIVSDAVVAVGAVLMVALILMVIAVGSVLAVQYFPNETFGRATDYLGLAVAAFSSSSVAAVVALLFLLRKPQAWYG